MKKRLISVIFAALLLTCMLPADIFAATGTVTGSGINLRSEPSTSGSVLGTASYGETFEITGSSTDAAGATWYAVTLSNGSTAYIRSDLIQVFEDPVQADPDPAPVPEQQAASDEEQAPSSEEDLAAIGESIPASQELPEVQLLMAKDRNGVSTAYLYFNRKGTRIKLTDIQANQDELRQLKKDYEAITKKGRRRVFVVLLLLVLVSAADVLLYLSLQSIAARRRRKPRHAGQIGHTAEEAARASNKPSGEDPDGHENTSYPVIPRRDEQS